MPKQLLIIYHSQTGGTQQMAQACAAAAAQVVGCQVQLLHAAQVQPPQVLAADGLVFATPENLASMSGQLKDFFDRCYYPLLDHLQGKPYASLICAGSDGQGAARQIERIATGWRLRAVAAALIVCTQAQTTQQILAPKQLSAAQLQPCTDLGQALAEALVLGVF